MCFFKSTIIALNSLFIHLRKITFVAFHILYSKQAGRGFGAILVLLTLQGKFEECNAVHHEE